jgi:glutathione peroxidase
MNGLHDFQTRSLRGEPVALSRYAGQVALVVNTASQCGLTPQYTGLESLYREYAKQGFVVLGFPCNQFGNQEPGDADSIEGSCLVNYGVSFPMFEKVDVKGPNAHPLFAWLTTRLPGILGRQIKWNFTKFLIGRDGQPLRRFAPTTRPDKIERHLVKVLGAA